MAEENENKPVFIEADRFAAVDVGLIGAYHDSEGNLCYFRMSGGSPSTGRYDSKPDDGNKVVDIPMLVAIDII